MVTATPTTSAIAAELKTIHRLDDDGVREAACGDRERLVPGRCDFVVLDGRDAAVDGVFGVPASRLVVESGDFLTCHV